MVAVLENGRLVETGTHTELMAIEGGRYRKMVDAQRKGLLQDSSEEESDEADDDDHHHKGRNHHPTVNLHSPAKAASSSVPASV